MDVLKTPAAPKCLAFVSIILDRLSEKILSRHGVGHAVE
jgi:hypothetical protein